MTQTKAGAAKARQTLINKFGSFESYNEWLHQNSSKGGKNGTGYPFAHGKVDPKVAGRLGGSKKKV